MQVLSAIFLTAFSPIKLGNCSSKINCSAICSSHGVVRNSHHFYFIKSNEEGSYRIFVEFYDFHIMDPSKCSIRRFILYFNDSLIHMSVIARHILYVLYCISFIFNYYQNAYSKNVCTKSILLFSAMSFSIETDARGCHTFLLDTLSLTDS